MRILFTYSSHNFSDKRENTVHQMFGSGTIQTDQGWIELNDQELHDLLVQKNLEIHEIAKDVIVDIIAHKIDDRNTRLLIHVEGKIANLPFEDDHETIIRCSNGVSPSASRQAGNYFEATVQLRSIGRKLDDSELKFLEIAYQI